MLQTLELTNFKCFERATIPLAPLTLLSGLNGMGKSSVLQSLLLLRQSWEQGLLARGQLALNGDLVQVGTAQDALYSYAEEERIGFRLGFADRSEAAWSFTYDRRADVLSALSAPAGAEQLAVQNLFGPTCQYLCAERTGPRTSFATSDFLVRHHRQVGARGEYAAHFLSVFGKERVASALLHEGSAGPSLAAQVEAWLAVISPGTRLKVTSHPAMDLVQLQYQFVTGQDVSDPYRATNVGFGLTFTLPVLVATLAAKPGALLLLENPEAHLHPRGQRRMGEFLALAASAGVQVILETHSDHLLNGIRLSVCQGKLSPDDVRLHFFERVEDGLAPRHQVLSPRIDRNGRIDQWPAGFFDEWDTALDQLLMPRAG
jgi:predicted ATPase